MRYLTEWLPADVLSEIKEVEPKRFHAVALSLESAWNGGKHGASSTLQYISIVKCFLNSKGELEDSDVHKIASIALDIVLHSQDDLSAQGRWSLVLSHILRKFRHSLRISIPWRPLHDILWNVHYKRRNTFVGLAFLQTHRMILTNLIQNSTRYFPAGSAAEIWNKFRPFLDNTARNDTFQALGFLALFMPVTPPLELEGDLDPTADWAKWVSESITLWSSIPNCPSWDQNWLFLISRCAKHLPAHSVPWETHLPSLFTGILLAFKLVVGTTKQKFKIERKSVDSIGISVLDASTFEYAGKALAYLLGWGSGEGSAVSKFESLVDVIESYYHPSNDGEWTSGLQSFFHRFSLTYLKRLAIEKQGLRPPEQGYLPPLDPESESRVIESLLRVVHRAQYSKSSRLQSYACAVASGLSYLSPIKVLPFVIQRFQEALETVTATHQLGAALATMARCVRPILLAASPLDSAMDIDVYGKTEEEALVLSGRSVIAQALVATLPGIDANDPQKTKTTIQFYCSVLSCIGTISEEGEEGSHTLPMDWSVWVHDLMSRLLSLIAHLEPKDEANKTSYLTNELNGSTFRHFVCLLFSRLSPSLYNRALGNLAAFVQSTVVQGGSDELALICGAAVYANPKRATDTLLVPCLDKILDHLHGIHGKRYTPLQLSQGLLSPSPETLSPALQDSVSYLCSLASTMALASGRAILAHSVKVKEVLTAAFNAPSIKVNEEGRNLLDNLIHCCIAFYPLDQYRASPFIPDLPGVELWMSTKEDSLLPAMAPQWHVPTQEELSFAEELLREHAESALSDLSQICDLSVEQATASKAGIKSLLQVLFLRLEGVLKGCRTMLPDFPALPPGASHEIGPLAVVGKSGATIGSWDLRERASSAFHRTFEFLSKSDIDDSPTLCQLLLLMDCVANNGSLEYSLWTHYHQYNAKFSSMLSEVPASHLYPSDAIGKRRPSWLHVEKVYEQSLWRASQAGYRITLPGMGQSEAPPSVVTLLGDAIQMAANKYQLVQLRANLVVERICQRYPSLASQQFPSLCRSLSAMADKETIVGICNSLTSKTFMRATRGNPTSFLAFIHGVLSSASHESPQAQDAILQAILSFFVQFAPVPISQGTFSPAWRSTMAELLTLDTGALHWRFALLRDCFLLLLVPADHNLVQEKSPLLRHFVASLTSEIPPIRSLAVEALLLLFASPQPRIDKATMDALASHTFAQSLIQGWTADHHDTDASSRSQVNSFRNRGSLGKLSQMMARFGPPGRDPLVTSLNTAKNLPAWPATKAWIDFSGTELFSPARATLISNLVHFSNGNVCSSFRETLEASMAETGDRGLQSSCAEAMAGLLRCHVGLDNDSWQEWLGPLLRNAVDTCPVESAPDWFSCARFATTEPSKLTYSADVTEQETAELQFRILSLFMEPLSGSASSSQLAKRLRMIGAVLGEIVSGNCVDTRLVELQGELFEELKASMGHPATQVRNWVAILLSMLTSYWASKMGLVGPHGDLADSCRQFVGEIPTKAWEVSQRIQKSAENADSVSNVIPWMNTVLFWIVVSVKSGDIVCQLDLLVGCLPSILLLQECFDHDLASIAKVALGHVEPQLLLQSNIGAAIGAIQLALSSPSWHCRAASLSYLQSFVFRHMYFLHPVQLEQLVGTVIALLADCQLEVRELASVTLAGCFRGMSEGMKSDLRGRCLAQVRNQTRNKTKKRAVQTGELSNDVARQHGLVLWLASLVASSPYDVPEWLPEVLVSLASFSREPPPIQATVSKAFGEFRRTHADSWAFQKEKFSPDQLEVLAGINLPPAYFV